MRNGLKMRNGHFLLCNYFKTIRDINLKSKAYDQGRLAKFGDDDHDGSRTVGAAQEASEKADSAKKTYICPTNVVTFLTFLSRTTSWFNRFAIAPLSCL